MKLLPSLLALSLSGTALAQAPSPPPPGAPHPADQDRDGVVTRAEALAEADRRFAAMDADGDGKVTRDERVAFRETHGRPGPGPRADRDGGGRRGGGEMTQAQSRERAAAMFDRTDTNRDGRIDAQEREAARLLMRSRMIERRD